MAAFREVLLYFRIRLRKDRDADAGGVQERWKSVMSKLDEKVGKYIQVVKDKGVDLDTDLLRKVTRGCGPSIYSADSETIAVSQPKELETVKNNFLIKKLGLSEGPKLDEGLSSVLETYGMSDRNKYRAVIYYMLTKHFGKEAVYK